jgi:hypothetical protein
MILNYYFTVSYQKANGQTNCFRLPYLHPCPQKQEKNFLK